jgi:hypothetical protein
MLQVESDALLVPVDAVEIAAEGSLLVIRGKRTDLAGTVAVQRFDFDDLGAKVCKYHRAVRTGQGMGEVHDL